MLPAGTKILKLSDAFRKIAKKHSDLKWMFRCIRNYSVFIEFYGEVLDFACNVRSFTVLLLDDPDMETRPMCFSSKPCVAGMDYLYWDIDLVINVLWTEICTNQICDDLRLNTLFEIAHSIYAILKAFRDKYVSSISSEN